MALFERHSVLLELKRLTFEEKKKLKLLVTENGGHVCFVVNKQCSLVVTSDASCLSSSRLRSIYKHQTPVVGVDYIYSCVERGVLLPVDEYRLDGHSSSSSSSFLPPLPPAAPREDPLPQRVTEVPASKEPADQSKGRAEPVRPANPTPPREETHESSGNVLERFRIYTDNDGSLPAYPDKFHVAKYSIFEKVGSSTWCVLELQSAKGEKGVQYRVVRHWKEDIRAKKAAVRDALVFLSTSEEALEVYRALREALQADGLQLRSSLPLTPHDLGSAPLQQLLLEEKLNTGSLSEEVGVFVELLWTEALGCLGNVLKVSIANLSLNDVSRAEGLLLQVQRKLAEMNLDEVSSLLDEVYTLLPHREPRPPATAKLVSQKLDLCQLIRDVLNVSEATLRSPSPSCLGKYRALRCSIETVPPHSSEFQAVVALVQHRKLRVRQVLRVSRGVELQTFKGELGSINTLLHSSSPSNFVGILSRGLLLPRVGVEHHGIERTDVGNLGSGIYFSDALSTSLKYSKPSVTDGSRLLLVCDVALGLCKDVRKRDPALNHAPEGHHSVHGVRRTRNVLSEFEDDEYVVYSPDQVKLKYVVQFSIDEDQLKEFSPAVDTSAELCPPPSDQEPGAEEDSIESNKNPLDNVTAGLLDSAGQQLPLQAVHLKCKLMDLLSQVIIFQKYTNLSPAPIEAKYVFPLGDSAAVCGFEAFINGKHVVGQVKEKETARKEYRQAIERGHGAYLMDQDAPDVFTISVGNLPPGATVLIKVTFVSELVVRDGSVFFSLPGSVAPWQQSAALNQTTQVSVEKVCVTDQAANTRDFSLDVSIEMPNKITSLSCITHKVKMKRTDCKAVVSVLPGEVMGSDGFQLSISLSEIHLPRMWVEKHPDKDSQACMLVFYPDFDVSSDSAPDEVVILLDTSESMSGESLRAAQRIALHVLKTLDRNVRLNVISFGTDHREVFLTAQTLGEASQTASSFIKRPSPVGGSTELWRPLRALGLLPPSRGLRNLLLLSDGHIQNAELTLRLLRDHAQHSRLFTCGLSPTANRHMLRALAQAGGGAYEFFDTKTKHNWTEKVARQVKRMASAGCSSASVKWQQFNPAAPPPVQAPAQLHALFSDCHTLVFGFVPHCTQATLHGNLSGQELETMVSTSELQKTKGTFLHKLTARAIIGDYEDGSLESNEAEHEGKKAELRSFIVELSKEFSILSQFTSFVAVEERHPGQTEEGFTDIPKLIAEEDVDFLPYISWISPQEDEEEEYEAVEEEWSEYECDFMKRDTQSSDSEDEMFSAVPAGFSSAVYKHTSFSAWPQRASVTKSDRVAEEYGEYMVPAEEQHQEMSELESRKSLQSRCVKIPSFSDGTPPVSPPPPPSPLYETLSAKISPHFFKLGMAKSAAPPPPPPPPSHAPSSGPHIISPAIKTAFYKASHFIPMSLSGPPPVHPQASSDHAPPDLALALPPPPPPLRPSGAKYSPMWEMARSAAPPPPPPPSHAPPSHPATPYIASHFIPMSPSGPPPVHPQASSDHAPPDLALALPPPPPPLRPSGAKYGLLVLEDLELDTDAGISSAGRACIPTGMRESLAKAGVQAIRYGTDQEFLKETSTPDFMPGMLFGMSHQTQTPPASNMVQLDAAPGPPLRSALSLAMRVKGEESLSDVLLRATGLDGWAPSFRGQSQAIAEAGPPQPASRRRRMGRHNRRAHPELRIWSQQETVKPPAPSPFPWTLTDGDQTLKWTTIFHMQHSEGFWEFSPELGRRLNVDVDYFANIFLKNKGICSLGVRAHADILRLVATLLVLQLMRMEKQKEGEMLRTLLCLHHAPEPRPARWEAVKRAVDWARWADGQYPCIYSRLEFGRSWESSTRQLLGYESLPAFSPLRGLKGTGTPLQVH